jgi:hypothetical protein
MNEAMVPGKWFESHSNLVVLANWLEENGKFGNVEEVIYFFTKPWKWDDAWKEYHGEDTP